MCGFSLGSVRVWRWKRSFEGATPLGDRYSAGLRRFRLSVRTRKCCRVVVVRLPTLHDLHIQLPAARPRIDPDRKGLGLPIHNWTAHWRTHFWNCRRGARFDDRVESRTARTHDPYRLDPVLTRSTLNM